MSWFGKWFKRKEKKEVENKVKVIPASSSGYSEYRPLNNYSSTSSSDGITNFTTGYVLGTLWSDSDDTAKNSSCESYSSSYDSSSYSSDSCSSSSSFD